MITLLLVVANVVSHRSASASRPSKEDISFYLAGGSGGQAAAKAAGTKAYGLAADTGRGRDVSTATTYTLLTGSGVAVAEQNESTSAKMATSLLDSRTAAASAPPAFTTEKVKDLMKTADTNNDGVLDESELKAISEEDLLKQDDTVLEERLSEHKQIEEQLERAHADSSEVSSKDANSDSKDVQEYFVVLADPQLGMSTAIPESNLSDDFSNEACVFNRLAKIVARFKPTPLFAFIAGDMQDAFPNKNPERGKAQRQEVRRIISESLDYESIPIVYTPGNHDINNDPSKEDIDTYRENWGALPYGVIQKDERNSVGQLGAIVLELNSQLYQSTTGAGAADEKKAQNDWLRKALEMDLNPTTRLIVVLTHIPPFMDNVDERSGWANWKVEDRRKVFDLILDVIKTKEFEEAQRPKVLWVCGHFHTNVEKTDYIYEGRDGEKLNMDVVVSSAAGSAMWWMNANFEGWLNPSEAATVASMDASAAVGKYIFGWEPKEFDRYNLKLPHPERSGLRIFKLCDNGKYEHKWYSLADLELKHSISGPTWKEEACEPSVR